MDRYKYYVLGTYRMTGVMNKDGNEYPYDNYYLVCKIIKPYETRYKELQGIMTTELKIKASKFDEVMQGKSLRDVLNKTCTIIHDRWGVVSALEVND